MPKLISDGSEYGYTLAEWLSFSKTKRWRIRNPEKMKAATKSWADRNKDRITKNARKSNLKKSYGITEEYYDQMLAAQGGKCAICLTDRPTGKWKVFAVDHCHVSGLVRGLLCNECNRGMGLLKDSAELLRAAADYLDCHAKKTKEERKAKCKK